MPTGRKGIDVTEKSLSYKDAGVDIDVADAAKQKMASIIAAPGAGVLNSLGAFGSLFDARFEGYDHPVLVLKMEEPGSKQLLALQHGKVESLCYDLVNHIVNDIAVMGALPLAMLDTIVCGKLQQEVVVGIVDGLSKACKEQGFQLVGGETSEQPGVLADGTYILSAAIIGVVEKEKVIDGSKIAKGDTVLAIASNGLHTNGYTLVRRLLEHHPELADRPVPSKDGEESFLEAVLRPHLCYLNGLREIFDLPGLHGLAHITGGGVSDNVRRILPEGTAARVDLGSVDILPVFRLIKEAGNVSDADMWRTFNMGVGMVAVVAPDVVDTVQARLATTGYRSYPIGTIEEGERAVHLEGTLAW